ncbi:MAG: hypothetical protein WKF94_02840 [Solirubrobacteraceae bacterium]
MVLHGPGHLRHLVPALDALTSRGHEITLRFDTGDPRDAGDRVAPGAAARMPERPAGWTALARQVRLALDHLRYLEPGYAQVRGPASRARARAPRPIVALADRVGAPAQARLKRLLTAVDRAVPVPQALIDELRSIAPDVMLVSPLVALGSLQVEHVRAARRLGVPSMLLVASWDNLTNKGGLRDVPDRVVVWNLAQEREARELHAVPADRITVTGAHSLDPWVGRQASSPRDAFCRRAGLDPGRPFVLYACSSAFIAPREPAFVVRWLQALGAGHDDAPGVLVRPHPANRERWRGIDIIVPGRVAVWHGETEDDYADSILHAAATVGINTSALLEAAAAGRPALTVIDEEFATTQTGTRHFAHLADARTGVLTVGPDLRQHAEQIRVAVADPGADTARRTAFLESFIRPLGARDPAALRLADAVEDVAARPARELAEPPSRRAAWIAPVARLTPGALRAARVLSPPRAPALAPVSGGAAGQRVLLVLDHAGLLMHFDSLVERLAERGHVVLVAFGRSKWTEAGSVLAAGTVSLDGSVPRRADVFASFLRRSRAALDAATYLAPSLRDAVAARAKWQSAPDVPLLVRRLPVLPAGAARTLARVLAWTERAAPANPETERWMRRIAPDLVIVSPQVQRDTYQDDVVKAARSLGVPSALPVASWDNLTSKGRIRVLPDRVLVWNAAQAREAMEHHGVPEEAIRVTGSPQFARWRRADAPPAAPGHVLFVGSQQVPVDAEADFIRAFLDAAEDTALRDLRVIVRPHPTSVAAWATTLADDDRVSVRSRASALPIGDEERAAYFQTLSAASAVIGVNSTAMLEAAIVGRPVHTVALDALRRYQRDLVHYAHLLQERGGPVQESSSFAELVRRLEEDLADPDAVRRRSEAFVVRFVRPPDGGSAVDRLVDELLATSSIAPRPPDGRGPARFAILPAAVLARALDRLRPRLSAARRAWLPSARAGDG